VRAPGTRRSSVALALGAAAVVLASSGAARADERDAEMRGYYGGERASAAIVGGMGLAAASAGTYLANRPDAFSQALGWTWIPMGSLEVLGAIGYWVSVDAEIDHSGAALQHDPSAYAAEERDHIHGTSSRFVYYRLIELSLSVGGAAAAGYGFAAGKDAWKGAGIGVASLALPVLVIDTINDARATRYLRSLGGAPTVGVAGTPGGALFSLAGHF
jgi:hypothetical protein